MKNTISTSSGSTVKWKEKLIRHAESKINSVKDVQSFYNRQNINIKDAGVHLAIFSEPFLTLLLDGKKTIESRFSINRVPPFQKVEPGDIVFIKKSGGDVIAFFVAGRTEYHHSPTTAQLAGLKKSYSKAIGTNSVENFWEGKKTAKYISLIEVSYLNKLTPVKVEKRDRTAWSVLKPTTKFTTKELWGK